MEPVKLFEKGTMHVMNCFMASVLCAIIIFCFSIAAPRVSPTFKSSLFVKRQINDLGPWSILQTMAFGS